MSFGFMAQPRPNRFHLSRSGSTAPTAIPFIAPVRATPDKAPSGYAGQAMTPDASGQCLAFSENIPIPLGESQDVVTLADANGNGELDLIAALADGAVIDLDLAVLLGSWGSVR